MTAEGGKGGGEATLRRLENSLERIAVAEEGREGRRRREGEEGECRLWTFLKVNLKVLWATPSETIVNQRPVFCFKNV